VFFLQGFPITISVFGETEQFVSEIIGDQLGYFVFLQMRILRAANVQHELFDYGESVNYPTLGFEGVDDARGSATSVNAMQSKCVNHILAGWLWLWFGFRLWLRFRFNAFAAALTQLKGPNVFHGDLAASAESRADQDHRE
jgi:hypothetical protein